MSSTWREDTPSLASAFSCTTSLDVIARDHSGRHAALPTPSAQSGSPSGQPYRQGPDRHVTVHQRRRPGHHVSIGRRFRSHQLVHGHSRSGAFTAAQDGTAQIVHVQRTDRMAAAAEQRDDRLRSRVNDGAGACHAGPQQDPGADDGPERPDSETMRSARPFERQYRLGDVGSAPSALTSTRRGTPAFLQASTTALVASTLAV